MELPIFDYTAEKHGYDDRLRQMERVLRLDEATKKRRRFLYEGAHFCTKFDPQNNFFKQRTSYNFKA